MTISSKIALFVGLTLVACVTNFSFAMSGASRTSLSVVLLIALAFLGVLWALALRSIVRPLKQMTSAMAITAKELDFTKTILVGGHDEIGWAAQAYNLLLTRLRTSFVEIQQSIAHMREVSEEVDHSSRKIAQNSELQTTASVNMAAAVEQMTRSISSVAGQTTEASQYAQESRDIAGQSGSVILSTVTAIQEISDSVREAATRIKALRVDCDSIASMAEMIQEIANQTNMLALNAAIESAHAGEHGRGFGVVADEVRKLSERTTESTREISGLLNRMQESARLAVDSMNLTEMAVGAGVINARQAGASIERLKTGAGAAAVVVEHISEAMREQETASSSIARHIDEIARMSAQNSAAASGSAAGVGRMTEVGFAMANHLSAYKVDSGPKQIKLRAASPNAEDHPSVRAMLAMGEILDQRTQGRITLNTFAGGVFGAEKETLEQVRAGTLDLARGNAAMLGKHCPAALVATLPYLFDSMEHMHRAMDGAPGLEILQACAEAGYVGLTCWTVTSSHMPPAGHVRASSVSPCFGPGEGSKVPWTGRSTGRPVPSSVRSC